MNISFLLPSIRHFLFTNVIELLLPLPTLQNYTETTGGSLVDGAYGDAAGFPLFLLLLSSLPVGLTHGYPGRVVWPAATSVNYVLQSSQ